MRTLPAFILMILTLPFILFAQAPASVPDASPQPELGKWWKNSGVVKELKLSEEQVNQIEKAFLNHQKYLVPLVDELKRHEDQLRMLMEAESLEDGKILIEAGLVADARARLERVNTSMLLSIRKAITAEQWKRLEEIQDLRETSSALVLRKIPEANSRASGAAASPPFAFGKEGVKPPQVLYMSPAPYTEEARIARVEGTVLLQVIVRKNGSVDSFKVLKGLGYGLDESAIRTIAREWRFEPGTKNGQPVDVRTNIEVSFRLY